VVFPRSAVASSILEPPSCWMLTKLGVLSGSLLSGFPILKFALVASLVGSTKVMWRHHAISGYRSNKLLNINMPRKRKSRSRLRKSEESYVSVYRVYPMSIDYNLIWIYGVW
jgi:type III secretory pathway component EscV